MTNEGRKCKKKGDVLVVGVKASPTSRELLTWTLAKFTNPGDHVIALHIASSPSEADALRNKSDSANQVADDIFDSVIGVYEGFCSIKQIDLQVKVTNGPSLRKVLVEAAKNYNAVKLILGTTNKQSSIGSPFSLANYCSKRLLSTCSVIVIQHGRVVFEKEGALRSLDGNSGMLNSIQRTLKSHSWKRLGQDTKVKRANVSDRPSDKEKQEAFLHCECSDFDKHSCDCLLPSKVTDSPLIVLHCHKNVPPQMRRSCDIALPNSYSISPSSVLRGQCQDDTLHTNGAKQNIGSTCTSCGHCSGQQKACQLCALLDCKSDSQESAKLEQKVLSQQASPYMDLEQSQHDAESSNEILTRALITSNSAIPPGWPLLHRSISMNNLDCPRMKARKMTVVEWALQLPDRQKEALKYQTELAEEIQSCSSLLNNRGTCYKDPDDEQQHNMIEEDSMEGAVTINPQVVYVATTMEKCASVCQNKYCKVFHFMELQAATNNFSAGNLVGQGGCSQVYEGVLFDGHAVAVKCLNASAPDSEQAFLTEVEIISGLHSCHIVQLIGYCVGNHHYLLVYNFASEGNLEQKLHHAGKGKAVLPWDARYKVAVGVAEALEYLHDGCARPVIHRDVKSSNILLSANLEPQLTDFGLAKWAPTSSMHITCSDVVGTFGYLAPEYFMYGKVNEKTDVYSFGVVLLELITGKHPIATGNPKGQENMVVWARQILEDESRSDQLIDPKLEGAYNASQLKNMMIAAALCLRQSAHSRPRMSRILKLLTGECEDLELFARQDAICKEMDEGYDMPNYEECDIRTHLTLALLGLDDDAASQSSIDHSVDFAHSNKFLEEYLGCRYSRSSSFE